MSTVLRLLKIQSEAEWGHSTGGGNFGTLSALSAQHLYEVGTRLHPISGIVYLTGNGETYSKQLQLESIQLMFAGYQLGCLH